MTEEQLDKLIEELGATRLSLDAAVKTIRWNKRNSVIQYLLIFAVFVMGTIGVFYYLNDRRDNCERGNDLRAAVTNSLDSNAASIGIAISIVGDVGAEQYRQYLDAYHDQEKPEALKPRSC